MVLLPAFPLWDGAVLGPSSLGGALPVLLHFFHGYHRLKRINVRNRLNRCTTRQALLPGVLLAAMHPLPYQWPPSLQGHQKAQGFSALGMECTRVPQSSDIASSTQDSLVSPTFVLKLVWIGVLLLKTKRTFINIICYVSPKASY